MTTITVATDKVRTYFQDTALTNCPFDQHPLAQAEPYVKELYITMLCLTAQYENELSREQQAFLQRLMTGLQMDKPLTEFIRKALTLDEEFAQEFYNEITGNDYEQLFVVDTLVLIHATASANPKQVELVAEIFDGLAIEKRIFESLLQLVSVILKHTESAKLQMPDEVKVLDFFYYLNTCEGALEIETKSAYYLINTNFDTIRDVETKAPELVVLASNLENLTETLNLSGFKRILFKDCDFNFKDCHFNELDLDYDEAALELQEIEEIQFYNCTVANCKTRFIKISNSYKLTLQHCEFKDCDYSNDWALGGIIINDSSYKDFDLVIENSSFLNCSIKTKNSWSDAGGVIFFGKTKCIKVVNNTFTNCNCYSNNSSEFLFKCQSNPMYKFEGNELVKCNSSLRE